MVTIRSVGGMNDDRMLSSVVLPAPVPPEMMHVEPRLHDAPQQLDHRLRRAVEAEQVLGRERVAPELPDREVRAVERERLDDGVDAAAVRQAGVHHGRGVVDAPADRGDDPVDHLEQVAVVLEADVGLLQPAVALDEDLL